MDAIARVSSKGQITIPQAVREALGLKQGDTVLFRVGDGQTTIRRIPDLMEISGAVEIPLEKRGTPWKKIIEETRRVRAIERVERMRASDRERASDRT